MTEKKRRLLQEEFKNLEDQEMSDIISNTIHLKKHCKKFIKSLKKKNI